MVKPFAYSIWLVPSHPLRDSLTQLIEELAQRYGTPPFTPHATLCSGNWAGSVEDLKQELDNISSALQPVTLATQGIDCCGDKWTQFFYLKLDNERVQPLFDRFGRALEGSHPPDIGAHLSLMYAEPSAGIDRKRLAAELGGRVPRQISFDQLRLITPEGPQSRTDLWQTQHVTRLIGAVT